MRAKAGITFLAAGLACLLALCGHPARGATAEADDRTAASSDPGRPAKKDLSAKKSPSKGTKTSITSAITSAFALPKGIMLGEAQQTAYEKLKKDKEPSLRDALDEASKAQGDDEKAKAAKKVSECRAEIRTAIQEILSMPYREAQAAAAKEAAKRPKEAGPPYGMPPGGYVPGYYRNSGRASRPFQPYLVYSYKLGNNSAGNGSKPVSGGNQGRADGKKKSK